MNVPEVLEREIKNNLLALERKVAMLKDLEYYRIAENLLIPILGPLFGSKLTNVNWEQNSIAPGIDLYDKENGRCFQVTARIDTNKVLDCIQKTIAYYPPHMCRELYLICLRKKQESYPQARIDKILVDRSELKFNANKHILDLTDISERVGVLTHDTRALQKMNTHLEQILNGIPDDDTGYGTFEKPLREPAFIPVLSIPFDQPLWQQPDPFTYDLATLVSLARGRFVFMYGHNNETALRRTLRDCEQILNYTVEGSEKRVWELIDIPEGEKPASINRLIDDVCDNDKQDQIGLIIVCESAGSCQTVCQALRRAFTSYNSLSAVIIDIPTSNIEVLRSFDVPDIPDVNRRLFVSADFNYVPEPGIYSITVFDDHIYDGSNIKLLLSSVDPLKLANYPAFNQLLSQLRPLQLSQHFDMMDMLAEFETALIRQGDKEEVWKKFFEEMITIIIDHKPEKITDLSYYCGVSDDPFIRYTLPLILLENKQHFFIDYWIEGTRGNKEKFLNIHKYIADPSLLISPLIKFYNRNRERADKKNIEEIIYECLSGDKYKNKEIVNIILRNERVNISSLFDRLDLSQLIELAQSGYRFSFGLEDLKKCMPLFDGREALAKKLLLSLPFTTEKAEFINKYFSFMLNKNVAV